MKYIITEEQFKKLNRSNESITKAIIKYLNQFIYKGNRQIEYPARNYGDYSETWCVNGLESIIVRYNFEDKIFKVGTLGVSKGSVDAISRLLSVRRSYVLHVIAEWYDDVMVPKFESIVGENGLSIDEIYMIDRDVTCIPEPVKPKGITDDEMIDYIVKNTLYKKDEVKRKIESGEDLEDFFMHILGIQNRQKERGI